MRQRAELQHLEQQPAEVRNIARAIARSSAGLRVGKDCARLVERHAPVGAVERIEHQSEQSRPGRARPRAAARGARANGDNGRVLEPMPHAASRARAIAASIDAVSTSHPSMSSVNGTAAHLNGSGASARADDVLLGRHHRIGARAHGRGRDARHVAMV